MCWVYLQSEPGLWTVGYYSPTGAFYSDADFDTRDDARRRCHYLNGGSLPPDTPL